MTKPRIKIGSEWIDPSLDNPSLRKLPEGWTLDTESPEERQKNKFFWNRIGDCVILAICLCIAFSAAIQLL